MNDALGYALELEGEGNIYAAARIYRGVLRQSPGDARVAALFARFNLNRQISSGVDMTMLRRFMSEDERERQEFKRWLIDGL